MRHPKGGPHYDGALDEDTWIAISGYGYNTGFLVRSADIVVASRLGKPLTSDLG